MTAFHEKGFGGVAIRPSREMVPAYLSVDFFKLFECALGIAKQHNLGVRLADDLSLPLSGFFKSIAEANPKTRAMRLAFEYSEVIPDKKMFEKTIDDPENAMVFVSKLKNNRIIVTQTKRLQVGVAPKNSISFKATGGDWQLIILRKQPIIDAACAYLPNPFSIFSAQAYIQNVLDAFKRRFGKYVNQTFEGFITELPACMAGENAICWDDDLITRYRSKYKKELTTLLPALFIDGDAESHRARVHIHSFIAQTTFEQLALPLERWAKNNRLSQWLLSAERDIYKKSTSLKACGMVPEFTSFSTTGIQNQEGLEDGSALLRAAQDINENEFNRATCVVLGRNRGSSGATIQQLVSEAENSMTPGNCRFVLDGCYFNIDQRSYLKSPYNPFWYSPDFAALSEWCTYVARIRALTADCTVNRQVAVLLPTASIMADFKAGSDEAVTLALENFKKTIDELHQLNYEYEVISEEALCKAAVRGNGEFFTSSRRRKGNFKVLIVPYGRLVSRSLFVMLEKLAIKAGKIIFIGEAPQGCIEDGIVPSFSARVEKMISSKKKNAGCASVKDLASVLLPLTPPVSVSLADKQGTDIVVRCAALDGPSLFYCHNQSDKQEYTATLEIPAQKNLYLVDGPTGQLIEITEAVTDATLTRLTATFAPRQTHYFIGSGEKLPAISIVGKNAKQGNKHTVARYLSQPRKYRVVLKDQWDFNARGLNAMPLASWNARIGLSRESGGFSHYYETYFEIKEIPEAACFVFNGYRNPSSIYDWSDKSMEISINGNRLVHKRLNEPAAAAVPADGPLPPTRTIQDFLCGGNVYTYDIKDSLKKGFNRISIHAVGFLLDPLALNYPPLIAGTFSIIRGSKGWVIDTAPVTAGSDSWARYGYPYFSGCGVYKQIFEAPSEFDRLVLKIAGVSGGVSIALNGKPYGSFNWQPIILDITEACESKRNELVITVNNTFDNMLRLNGAASGIIGETYLDIY
ncbi:MAG: hypothetical protein PHC61_01390 [Chitinivibrionales bacterium]|nr:hypothetical protein [Chitinivibrionales bacterium]